MSILTGCLNMGQLKPFPTSFVRIFSWLLFLLMSWGIATGAAQTPEEGLNGAIIFPNNEGIGNPGETVIYQHTVTNQGTDPDTFDLTADSSEGWFTNVSPEEVTLNGQQSTTILVTIVVATNAQQGDVDVTTVTVTSQSDPGITDFSTDTTLVPVPVYMPVMLNKTVEETPDCQLMPPVPDNPPGVDLIVTAISFNPNPPQAGQQTVVRVTVKNQGMMDVATGTNFYVDFYDDPVPEPPGPIQQGDLYWGVQGVNFGAGESVTLVGNYMFEPGFHHMYAQVDTDGSVDESNESNNVYGCLGLTVN